MMSSSLLVLGLTWLLVASSEEVDNTELEELKNIVSSLKQEIGSVKKENLGLRQTTKALKLYVAENAVKKRQTTLGHKIAFTALITPGTLTHLRPHTPVVFDRAITNVGHAYNSRTGRFTAPVNGTYAFVAGVLCLYHRTSSFEFVRDGVSMLPVHCDSRGMDGNESSSRTVTIHMNVGQDVWIQPTGNFTSDNSLWGHSFSDLTGFLVYED